MQIIGILNGAAAFHETVEEYQPPVAPPLQDLIETIRTTYQFGQFPLFPPGAAPAPPLLFGAGRFSQGDDVFAIGQLIMAQNGEIVVAGNTDQADLVLEHLTDLMDAQFGYRLRQSTLKKKYLSSVVIEFDDAVETYLAKVQQIEEIIDRCQIAERKPFKLKRLYFGDDPDTTPGAADPMRNLDVAEFIIERRTGQPFSQNRYFCSAPLSTNAHIAALQAIEHVLQA